MARQVRIEYEGACYHVLSRGNARSDIFLCDEDRQDFLDLLGEMAERFDVTVYAYVLMNNHYHLLLKTRKANLSRCMQWLGTGYTRRFNLRHSQCGHLFQGRFKNIIVENDVYLMQLSCYIHRNPLRAGIIKRLADYQWSSYRCYAYKDADCKLIETEMILSQFNAQDKHRAYREKVQKYSDEKGRIWDDVKHGLILGSAAFQTHIKDQYLSSQPDKELPQLNRVLKDEEPERLLEKWTAVLGYDVSSYKHVGRLAGAARDKRDTLIFALWNTGRYSNTRIGDLFGLTFSSVSRRAHYVKSVIDQNESIRDLLKRISI